MKKLKINGSKALAMVAGVLSAVAPSAINVAPTTGSGTVITQPQTQAPQGMQASQSRAISGAQQGATPVGHGHDFARPYSDWSTFPKYNQRKARRDARRVNRKVKR